MAAIDHLAAEAEESITDRELLHRFAIQRDEEAFAHLVARHGRMVLGVCLRFLPTVQDAEDACQATFLILARKAGGRWQPSVVNWLHTTARRVAAKARRASARRGKREGQAAIPESVLPRDDISACELFAILDEELERLPARYREPLVLCYLEGLSREEAAAQLGVPQATVKTRLERGRNRLEEALTRRGVSIGLGFLVLAIAPLTRASTRSQIESIVAAVSRPTPVVAALAQGSIANATLRRVMIAVVTIAVVAGFGLGLNAAGPVASLAMPQPTTPAVLEAQPADRKFQKEIDAARAKAIEFLKKQQQKDGTWKDPLAILPTWQGWMTSQVTLALLVAGVPSDDPDLAKSIEYIMKLEPKSTLVVSLQTQVLARADAKKHKEQIQKNVDWLKEQAFRSDDKLEGWSYPANNFADHWNTYFAMVALHEAARAGAKVDAKVWSQIRAFYARGQLKDGGWAEYFDPKFRGKESDRGATICGLAVIAIAAKYDPTKPELGSTFEKGMERLLAELPLDDRWGEAHLWMATAELGRALGTAEFKAGDTKKDWYREIATELLKTQKDDGSWVRQRGFDSDPTYVTVSALYFLGPPKK